MIDKIRAAADRRRAGEEGFTLIELLVVVIILIALAAVAIPIFLNQREKAENASAQTLVSNVANAISGGIGTGTLTASNTNGSAAVTGNIQTDAGTQNVGDATVWINVAEDKFCVSAEGATGTIYRYAEDAPQVTTGSACVAADVAP